MPKVICKLENAADEISGVKFTALEEGGRVSEEVSAEVAELFASIPGYELVNDAPKAAAKASKKAQEKAAEKPAEAAPEGDLPPAVTDPDESVF